ncbi:MAG: MFS transporter [Alphaproteobacteria bacterium]|nr:MFS transporter [Alphaproteobacteria bacterium]
MNEADRGATTQASETSAGSYRWFLLAGIWLVYFCFGMTIAAMAPLVAPITRDLGLSHAAMGAVLGAWPLVYIASAIPCGAFLDRVGPRWALFLAALVIALSGLLRGLAGSHLELFLAVAVFGLGGPLVSIGGPKLIAYFFEGKTRALAMGIYITGPATGGILALAATNAVMMPFFDGDWRRVLLAYAGFVLIASLAWLAIGAHPEGRAFERRLAAEARTRQIEVFLALLGLPAVRLVLLMSVGMFFFNHGLNNWLPEILRTGGMAAAEAGFWAAVPTAVGVLGSLVIPRLAVPQRRIRILLGLFLAAAAATLLLQSPLLPLLGTGLVLQGVARGSMMTIAVLVLLETPEVGARYAGLAGGLFFSAAEVGGVMGPLTVGYLSDLTGGFAAALYLMTAVMAALVVLLARLKRYQGG